MIALRDAERCVSQESGRFLYLLRQINLKVAEGEFISLMGPSGAGKSTLLHTLGMQDAAWSGKYFFDGQSVHQLKSDKRDTLRSDNIGFVLQNYHLLDDLTVYENLDPPLSYRDVKASERASIIGDALDRFRIVGTRVSTRGSFPAASNNSSALSGRWRPA